jgi:hypothetical protein
LHARWNEDALGEQAETTAGEGVDGGPDASLHVPSPQLTEDTFTSRLVAGLEATGADMWVDTAGITSDDFVTKISEG